MSSEAVLCVEDDPQVRRLFQRLLERGGHECATVGSAEEARVLLAQRPFAVVLCDIGLPGTSGLDLLAELVRDRPDVATVMVTGRDDPRTADEALKLGAYGYLTKPFSENELLIDLANALHRRRLEIDRRQYEGALERVVEERTTELREAERELRRAYFETVSRLGRAIDFHDAGTGRHVERVGAYAGAIAAAVGLGEDQAERLRLAAPLHDVGKLAVAESILAKGGPLTDEERVAVQLHTVRGHELLTGSGNELLELAATVALTHHERWDGGGYPRGLAGDAIPLEGRIVAVADVFDALTSDRPYRKRLDPQLALRVLDAERGGAFDSRVVDGLLASLETLSPVETAA